MLPQSFLHELPLICTFPFAFAPALRRITVGEVVPAGITACILAWQTYVYPDAGLQYVPAVVDAALAKADGVESLNPANTK